MNLVKGNINFTNEIIDQVEPRDILQNDTLIDLMKNFKKVKPNLVKMIGGEIQINNEAILSICLTVNDDLDKTIERFKALKEGRKPQKFVPGESSLQGDSALFLNPTHIYTYTEKQKPVANQQPNSEDGNAVKDDLFELMGPSQP